MIPVSLEDWETQELQGVLARLRRAKEGVQAEPLDRQLRRFGEEAGAHVQELSAVLQPLYEEIGRAHV